MAGDGVGLLAWLSAALFIPSFALAAGVWSNGSKVFEIVYITLMYMGPLNNIPALDFLGAHNSGNIGFYLPLSFALVLAALAGRVRQLRN
jgi:hypothetical protein